MWWSCMYRTLELFEQILPNGKSKSNSHTHPKILHCMRRVITKRPIWVNSEITMTHAVHMKEITTFWVNRRQIGLFVNGITVWKTHRERLNLLIDETASYSIHTKKFAIRIHWAVLNVCFSHNSHCV